MKRRDFLKATAAGGILAVPRGGAQPVTATGFTAGFAEADITPEAGMESPGGYGKSFAAKVHDPCKVRAVVFGDGPRRVAILGIDAEMLHRSVVLGAREKIQARTGIPPDAVMIVPSHSHSSGPVGDIMPGEYDHAPEFVRKLAYEQSPTANLQYIRQVAEKIVAAVRDADQNQRPLLCGVGVGHEDKAAYNRRFRMRNGQCWTHPGKGNPDILAPAAPIDPEVGVIGAWDGQGNLAGCVVNYACHATTSPGGFSANWIYYLEKTIRAVYGPQVVVVFVQGCCGDITQVDNLNPYQEEPGEVEAQYVGGRIGAEAVKVLISMHKGTLTPLAAANQTLRIPRRVPSPERVKRSIEMVRQKPEDVGETEWTFAKEIVLLDAKIAKDPAEEVEVQAIQVGPAAFLSMPGEMFVDFGLEMKRRSNFRCTFPTELANGSVGYVPTEEALGPKGGGYETRLTSLSNLAPFAGRTMMEACLRLAAKMTPGPVPEPARAQPFDPKPGGIGSTPWSYGNVPPELS